MKDVMGVDISTEKISYVFKRADGSSMWGELISDKRGPRGGVLKDPLSIISQFEDYVAKERPEVIYIEGLAWIKNRESYQSIARMLGAITYACYRNGITYKVVLGKDWKQGLLLAGNEKKPEIREWVILEGQAGKMTGNSEEPFESQDLYDAYCIVRYAIMKEESHEV